MSNTEQIVRQIIDILSDSVSELVLLVIVLREQNAPMPPHLPTASAGVNETAKKLGLIARKLASTDYKDFQEIAEEINTAADALDNATQVLAKAVQTLQTGGVKKEAWDHLVEACRVMSGKTIRLLQIVYGAPLKRLKINADRLLDQLNHLDTHPKGLKDVAQQQKLLDTLKPISDKALRLEKHLGDRAKLAESPQAKQQLADQAADTHKKIQDLVDAVNKAIADPDKADLTKPIEALRDAVDKGRDLSEKTAPPAPKGLPEHSPLSGPFKPSPGPKSLHDDIEQAKEMAKAIPDIVQKNPTVYPEAQDQLKDKVDQIRKKVKPNPTPEEWKKDVEEPLAKQQKAAKDVLKTPNNPAAKKALDDTVDDVVKALDDIDSKHAGATPRGAPPAHRGPGPAPKPKAGHRDDGPHDPKLPPIDPQTKKKLKDAVKDVAPDIAKNIPPGKKPAFEKAKLKDAGDALQAELKKKNPKKAPAQAHAKQAAEAAKQLAKVAKDDLAKDPPADPEEKKRKEEGIAALEKAIPEFEKAADDAIKDGGKNPEAKKDLGDKLKKLERAAERAAPKAAPVASKPAKKDWRKAQPELEKAIEAVKKGDKPAAKKALEKAAEKALERAIKPNPGKGLLARDPADGPSNELQKLWDKLKNAADRGDPKAIDDILPEIEDAYKKYADVPKKAADRFDDAVKAVEDAIKAGDPNPPIDDLEDEFDNFVNDTQKDPSPEVRAAGAKAAEELKPKLDDFIKKAREAAKAPNDKQKAQAAQAAAPALKKPIDDFKKAIKPLDDDFEKAKDEIKKVADAVKKGDKPAAKKALDNLGEKPFGRNWVPQKGRGVLPQEKPDGISDELKDAFNKLKNAGNRDDPKKMFDAIPPIEKNLKKVVQDPKQKADDVKDAIDDLVEAAHGKGDPEKAAEALRDAIKDLEKEAKKNPSPPIREAVQDAADEIEPLIDDFIRKADDAARHPQDKKKAQEAQQAAENAKKPLEKMKNRIKPAEQAVEKALDDLKKAAEAARKGDKPALKDALQKLEDEPFGIPIVPSDAPLSEPPPEEELEKAFEKAKDAIKGGNPRAAEKAIPKLERAYEKVAGKPKKAADAIKIALDDLEDAIRDPKLTPPFPGAPIPPGNRIPDAIRDVDDIVDDFIRDVVDTDPSPEVRDEAAKVAEQLKPKLADAFKKAAEAAKDPTNKKKADDAIAAVQEAKKPIDDFKKKLAPLDNGFNKTKDDLKKAADAVKKGDRPAAKKVIDSLPEKPLGRNFTPGKGKGIPDPEGPNDELKKMFDKFKKAADKGDPATMDRLIPEMDKKMQQLAEKPKNAAEKLKRAADDVAKAAAAGNPNPPLKHLKKAMDDFVNDTQSDPSPEVREAGAKAADEIFPSIIDLIKKAEDAAKHPQDKQKAQQVGKLADQIKKPLDDFKEKIKPLDNAWNRNKDDMKKAADAVKKGDRPGAKKILDNLGEKPFGRNFKPGKGKGLPPTENTGPTDELKKLWKKFNNDAKKGDAPAMEKALGDIEKAFDKVADDNKANPMAAADDIQKALDDALAAVDDGRPIPLKEVKDAMDKFQQETANHPDPQVQYAGAKAVENFKPQFAELIKLGKEIMEAPKDKVKDKVRAFENQIDKAKQPIKKFKVDADPRNADDVIVHDKVGGDVKDALADLKKAIDNKKPPEILKALDDVKDKLADYNDKAHDLAKTVEDPGKSNYIDRKADELDDLLEQIGNINPANPDFQDVIHVVPEIIDDIMNHLNSSPTDDAIEGAAKSANLTAFLESVDDDDLDLGDLLGTATDLADLMRGMIGQTTAVAEDLGTNANNLTASSQAAFDLSVLLREIESGYDDGSVEGAQAMSERVSTLRQSDYAAEPVKTLAEATTFEDITAAVAFNIRKQCDEQQENISKTGANVASELASLANAARGGDRQAMLLAAKAASAHIAALSKEILALANKIPGKNPHEKSIQDHLIRCSQGLGNYGTQLKILTSVKAASIEQSKDTDESLSTISYDLGDLISQALTSMSITNSTILKGK